MWDSFLNLIFPPRCEVCQTNNSQAICQKCFSQIKFMKPHLGVHCVSVYDGALRTAIHRFKFKGRKKLAHALGLVMVQYLSQSPSLAMNEIDLIVPVPLHNKRLRQRGFNQTELLARVLSKYYGVPVQPALARTRDTKAQFDLPRTERFTNIDGAFEVIDHDLIHGRRVLLLDDIYTTGATIAECSKALQAAGARRVEILTLSRALEQ
jgi:ComF family protein